MLQSVRLYAATGAPCECQLSRWPGFQVTAMTRYCSSSAITLYTSGEAANDRGTACDHVACGTASVPTIKDENNTTFLCGDTVFPSIQEWTTTSYAHR